MLFNLEFKFAKLNFFFSPSGWGVVVVGAGGAGFDTNCCAITYLEIYCKKSATFDTTFES